MDTNMKLKAAEELNMGELDAVAGGAFSTMDVKSKITPIAMWLAPLAGVYSAAAMTYDAFK
jgi:hypothetical protein